jgi:hypothetical protein
MGLAGSIPAATWLNLDRAGQFNADFMAMLVMSAIWVAWRNNFSKLGFLIAPLAFLGGAAFLSA